MERSPELAASHRTMMRGLILAAVFAVLIAIAAGILATSASSRSNRAIKANTIAIHESCLNDNRARAAQVELWSRIFAISPTPADPAAAARATTLREFIANTFAPRDRDQVP